MKLLLKRYATHIYGCSEKVLDVMFGSQWIRNHRISVLHNGISLKPYGALEGSAEKSRARFGIPTLGPIVGHIGRLSAAKNHQFLLRIFQRYQAGCPSATLVLAGEGELRDDLELQVAELGLTSSVRFLGLIPQDAIPELLKCLDVLVMPSLHEGLPVTLVEAQCAGVPCVVSSAVTRECDLGLQLVDFVDLNRTAEEWSQYVSAAQTKPRPSWEVVRQGIQAKGYDIATCVGELTRLYRGGEANAST
jgi:glycosyltransferase EpsF